MVKTTSETIKTCPVLEKAVEYLWKWMFNMGIMNIRCLLKEVVSTSMEDKYLCSSVCILHCFADDSYCQLSTIPQTASAKRKTIFSFRVQEMCSIQVWTETIWNRLFPHGLTDAFNIFGRPKGDAKFQEDRKSYTRMRTKRWATLEEFCLTFASCLRLHTHVHVCTHIHRHHLFTSLMANFNGTISLESNVSLLIVFASF